MINTVEITVMILLGMIMRQKTGGISIKEKKEEEKSNVLLNVDLWMHHTSYK